MMIIINMEAPQTVVFRERCERCVGLDFSITIRVRVTGSVASARRLSEMCTPNLSPCWDADGDCRICRQRATCQYLTDEQRAKLEAEAK